MVGGYNSTVCVVIMCVLLLALLSRRCRCVVCNLKARNDRCQATDRSPWQDDGPAGFKL